MIAHTTLAVSNYRSRRSSNQGARAARIRQQHGVRRGSRLQRRQEHGFLDHEGRHRRADACGIRGEEPDEVAAFHRAALAAGGKDNGGPGYRAEYWPGYYASFVYDPDGNNIEAVWYDYGKVK